jgi:predicted Fe-Mo cluster-binding NifX family protein
VEAFADSEAAEAFQHAIAPILALSLKDAVSGAAGATSEEGAPKSAADVVRIAIPLVAGKLTEHFGQSEQFFITDVASHEKKIVYKEMAAAPDIQPGLMAQWLRKRGVEVLIVGDIGRRALSLFEEQGISVHLAEPGQALDDLIARYLEGKLDWA